MKRKRIQARRQAFTLIEVLLVLVILVILASMGGLFVRRAQQGAMINAAKAQIGNFKSCIETYQLSVRNYPSTSTGLQALLTPPSELPNPARWQGPYFDQKQIPLDPWDKPYQYQLVDNDTYLIWSLGPDGNDGTEDDIRSDLLN